MSFKVAYGILKIMTIIKNSRETRASAMPFYWALLAFGFCMHIVSHELREFVFVNVKPTIIDVCICRIGKMFFLSRCKAVTCSNKTIRCYAKIPRAETIRKNEEVLVNRRVDSDMVLLSGFLCFKKRFSKGMKKVSQIFHLWEKTLGYNIFHVDSSDKGKDTSALNDRFF